MKSKTLMLTEASLIAALYVVLTLLSNIAGLASGVIQLRLSEMLTVLPMFTRSAVPGLTIGCIIANMLTGCALWDVVFGSLATLLGAVGTMCIGKKKPLLALLCPIVSNTLIVPKLLQSVYGAEGSYLFFTVTVGLGELLSCGVLGLILYKLLKRTDIFG